MDTMQTASAPVGAKPTYDAPTVCAAFQAAVAAHADRVAIRTMDDSTVLTWSDYGEQVEALAGGLAALGVKRGHTVATQLTNRPEFHLVDMAAVHLGATGFSVYNTSSPEQVAERLDNAESRIFVTERAFLPVVRDAAERYGRIEHIVVVDGTEEDGLTLEQVKAAAAADFDFESAWRAVEPGDVLTLIFTSGTTGPPKAAQLSHHGVMTLLRSLDQVVPLPRANVISFMPMAHVAERLWSQYMPTAYGARTTCCPDRAAVFQGLQQIRPDHVWLLPRMWQKLKEAIDAQVEAMEPERRDVVRHAIEVGLRRVAAEQAGEALPAEVAAEAADARDLLRREFVVPLGLDQATATGVGGAPSPRSLVEFFNAIGIPLFEGYGLTEATGFGAIFSNPAKFRIGTIGRPLPGVEIELAEDGELLLRSEMNMLGYRNQPEATRQAIDAEGWLHTGDIAEIDDDGYVRIVDRKKDLIINAYGKNMSPVQIEEVVRAESPLIGQVVAVGDGRPYNVALITLEAGAAGAFARQHGLETATPEELATNEALREPLSEAVERANARLSRVEQIKRFAVLARDWPPDSEELTPTMKLKRKPIATKYANEIEALYASHATQPEVGP
jgi:long-subunit acyl-CoA synthetase (AMP-forming)